MHRLLIVCVSIAAPMIHNANLYQYFWKLLLHDRLCNSISYTLCVIGVLNRNIKIHQMTDLRLTK